MLEKVADSARKAVKLTEPYKPYGEQFLEFCSISLCTDQTCMKLTRKSTEFCQFFCRHYPQRPTAQTYLKLTHHLFKKKYHSQHSKPGVQRKYKKITVRGQSPERKVWLQVKTGRITLGISPLKSSGITFGNSHLNILFYFFDCLSILFIIMVVNTHLAIHAWR